MARRSGILLHISSLPGPDGIGSLGREAYEFADFLAESGMHIWQVLPLGPTGYGESPYQSASVFAGNPMLISLETLREQGLLQRGADPDWQEDTEKSEGGAAVDFEAMRAHKEKELRACFEQSEQRLREELAAFRQAQPWVEDFALFIALKQHFGGVMWTKWPEERIRMHRKAAVAQCREQLAGEIRYHIFCQYLFFTQWQQLKAYCNERDIQLFGDMPIYVAEDSADTWTHPDVFQLDKNRVPKRVAGVPPDLFSADGQLWGNPLYRWRHLQHTGYQWWVERMAQMSRMYDIIRVDHFIGFANYYSIPYGAPNARTGRWIVGPGKDLFLVFNEKLPGLNIVAEDLGVVNKRVRDLLRFVGYPGMGVLAFGFGAGDDNPHLMTNYKKNCVAYTGTHDNDTVLGWVDAADEESLAHAKKVLGFTEREEAPMAFIRAVMASRADTAVILMQDVLGLDGSCRMNLPGTTGGNWKWRMLPGAVTHELAAQLKQLNLETHR